MRFGNSENTQIDGQTFYKTVQNQITAQASNVSLVAGQSASATISGTSSTVALTSVTAGNTLVIAYGAKTPTFSTGNAPTLSDSQSQTINLIVKTGGIASSAGCYANISKISGALSGTHTITIQTTDISQAGEISIYELKGVQSFISASNFNASATTITVSPLLTASAKQFTIGAASSVITGGAGASYAWSGGGTQGSLSQDGSDANFNGINGHLATTGTQDFGAARQGTGTPSGQSVVGAVFQ